MDKSILKKFAIESRQDLMNKVSNKIKTFFVNEEFKKEQKGEVYLLSNEKHSLSLTKEENDKRDLLIKRIKELTLEQVIEEAAYTWFNRIIAIRYMEINDMLPLTKNNSSLGIRVLSSKDNTPDPEILKFTNLTNPDLDIDFKREKYIELKDDNEKFKYILLLICKKLGKVIPQVFDGVTDYIDILIPDNLLNDAGFITKIINDVPEENYNQVEIIGWLYQYYNQTEKDRVMAQKTAHKKNEIPYATQIFTPDWIVKYMVDNSLGKYLIEHFQTIKKENLKLKYYVENDEEIDSTKLKINDIKFIDPCSGSGHILLYAFEVFYKAYTELGYPSNEISEQIMKYNLYGLDIDDRAGQLSVLSVILKAREYDKQIFNKSVIDKLNIMSIKESNSININNYKDFLDEISLIKVQNLIEIFYDAKEKGSLLKLKNENYDELKEKIEKDESIFSIELKDKLLPIIKISELLTQKYDIIVTNPPYMSNGSMSSNLKKYLEKNYKNGKNDFCTAFMLLNNIKENGYLSMINQQSWMFLGGFENLRKEILERYNIKTFLHLGIGTFGADFGTCSFVMKNSNEKNDSIFIRLCDFKSSNQKEEQLFNKKLYYYINQHYFSSIPGNTLSYWITEKMIKIFEKNKKLNEYYFSGGRNKTHNDDKYIRLHWEIQESSKKWVQYAKGGEYRKWYGNIYYVVNWDEEAKKEYKSHGGLLKEEYKNNEGMTWSIVTSYKPSFRLKDKGVVFSSVSPTIMNDYKFNYYILGLLNSIVTEKMLELINSTLATNVSDVLALPVIFNEEKTNVIDNLVKCNIDLSKEDWNSFETSIDFTKHPLLKPMSKVSKIRDSIANWNTYTYQQRSLLKHNEEELNKIFIDIYGLNDELTPEVDDKDITIRKEDKVRDIKSLISYAVGCMFGRYSLDEDGLIYAGGEFDIKKYKTFKVDMDNIIPITDEAYFSDDIVERFKTFIKTIFGDGTFNENMDFIAETLGKKGTETSEETIRRYFVNDFFNDHCKIYQKRPIYWLLDSGKKNGFKALIYIHRYSKDLVATIRTKYIPKVQTTYEKLLSDVEYKLSTDLSLADKKEMEKKKIELNGKIQEVKEYYEMIANVANKMIDIDLDDGVVVNYAKFTYLNPKTNKEESILGKIK